MLVTGHVFLSFFARSVYLSFLLARVPRSAFLWLSLRNVLINGIEKNFLIIWKFLAPNVGINTKGTYESLVRLERALTSVQQEL